MKQVIRYDLSKFGSLCCDNPECNHEEPSGGLSESLINKPCPKCGENLLTQDSFDRTIRLIKIIDKINSFFASFGLGSENDKDFTGGKVSVRMKPNGATDVEIKLNDEDHSKTHG